MAGLWTRVWTATWRQAKAYGLGVLVGGAFGVLASGFLSPWLNAEARGPYPVPFSVEEAVMGTLAVAGFGGVLLLVPFLLGRWIVAPTARLVFGRVGPLAAALTGVMPALLLTLLMDGFHGLDLNAFAYWVNTAAGAVAGLV